VTADPQILATRVCGNYIHTTRHRPSCASLRLATTTFLTPQSTQPSTNRPKQMSEFTPSTPFPSITVLNHSSTPSSTLPVELGNPPAERTTYLVHLFPQLNENEEPSLVLGKGSIPNQLPDDLLAALSKCSTVTSLCSPLRPTDDRYYSLRA